MAHGTGKPFPPGSARFVMSLISPVASSLSLSLVSSFFLSSYHLERKGFSTFNGIRTDNGRPSPFCGVSCDDPTGAGIYCSAAYESAWAQWLSVAQTYLTSQGIANRTYYYTQNEPQVILDLRRSFLSDRAQNWNDYNAAAYLCQEAKAAAPNFPIMISKGARPEIAQNPTYGCVSFQKPEELSVLVVPRLSLVSEQSKSVK